MFSDFKEGAVVLINKPYRWTSFDVVNKVRSVLKYRLKLGNVKTGHAGTLDPLATGLLIICTGKFTKRIEEFQNQQKEYTGSFVLGATTPSYDLETAVEIAGDCTGLSPEQLRAAAQKFTGVFPQIPPVYSARFVNGTRAYEYARAGQEVVMEPRTVDVAEFDITRIALPEIEFRIACSKGTYIRSLARDFGVELGCGAYLSALCRTRIGSYHVNDALSLEQFELMAVQNLDANETI
jgi:tRNA pseudouridine55 synthase